MTIEREGYIICQEESGNDVCISRNGEEILHVEAADLLSVKELEQLFFVCMMIIADSPRMLGDNTYGDYIYDGEEPC